MRDHGTYFETKIYGIQNKCDEYIRKIKLKVRWRIRPFVLPVAVVFTIFLLNFEEIMNRFFS